MRMLFLQSMKSVKKILFQLVFLYAVLFCFGHIMHSFPNSQQEIIELATSSNNTESNTITHADFVDHEQMSQTIELTSIIESIGMMPVIKYNFPQFIFSFINWQPPKF
jgi:hypothetical protein